MGFSLAAQFRGRFRRLRPRGAQIRPLLRVLALLLVGAPAVPTLQAHADEPVPSGEEPREAQRQPSPPQPNRPLSYVSLSLGASSAGGDASPAVCLFANPWWRLAVTACGSGSELWRKSRGSEISTYLLHYRLTRWRTQRWMLAPYLGAGFAEFQIGDDVPGFSFGDPQALQGRRVSVAGPAASLLLRSAVDISHGFEGIASLALGAGYFARADELQVAQPSLQPFAQFLLGIGY